MFSCCFQESLFSSQLTLATSITQKFMCSTMEINNVMICDFYLCLDNSHDFHFSVLLVLPVQN